MNDLIITTLRRTIPDLEAVYQFGSSGTIYERPDSDLDLAFLTPRYPIDSIVRFELQQELSVLLKKSVDLIDLRAASTVFRFQIISTGTCIYFIDEYKRDSFETLVYSQFYALNEEQKELIADIKKRGSVY